MHPRGGERYSPYARDREQGRPNRTRFTINAIPMHDINLIGSEAHQMAERSDEGDSLGEVPQTDEMIEPPCRP